MTFYDLVQEHQTAGWSQKITLHHVTMMGETFSRDIYISQYSSRVLVQDYLSPGQRRKLKNDSGHLELRAKLLNYFLQSNKSNINQSCLLSAQNAHAPVHARLYNSAETSLPWKLLRTYLESCSSISVQAVVCRPLCCCLDEISHLTMFAQVIRPNPRQLMTQSSLRCLTSIIQSSALLQASGIWFVYQPHSNRGQEVHLIKNSVFTIFTRELTTVQTAKEWQ